MSNTTNEPKCSFCGRSASRVGRLIAGPGVYICDNCIDFCASLLFEDEVSANKGKKHKKEKKEKERRKDKDKREKDGSEKQRDKKDQKEKLILI